MPNKFTFEYVREFINKEEKLISKNYLNNKQLLQIECKTCKKIYNQNFDRYKRGHRCRSCAMSENGKKGAIIKYNTEIFIKDMIKICIQCNKDFTSTISNQKICNKECALEYTQTQAYKDLCKKMVQKVV